MMERIKEVLDKNRNNYIYLSFVLVILYYIFIRLMGMIPILSFESYYSKAGFVGAFLISLYWYSFYIPIEKRSEILLVSIQIGFIGIISSNMDYSNTYSMFLCFIGGMKFYFKECITVYILATILLEISNNNKNKK